MNQKVTDITVNLARMEFEAMCVGCTTRWQADVPERTILKEMECPVCHLVGNVISTGQIYFDD